MEDWIIFFVWGGGTISTPPVLLIEASMLFNDGVK